MDEQEKIYYDLFDLDESLKNIDNAEIDMNYCMERDYMDAIKNGNINEALKIKKELETRVGKLRPRKLKLEELRCAYAVNRAMSRIAAYEAGIPAPIIHKITSKESLTIGMATSEKQMEDACVEMLKEFCSLIRDINNNKYSAMVQSVIYSINQHFKNDISVRDIADEIGVSESYMISQFRKETGTTPAIYLRDVRLKNAANLLISTEDEIQKICGQVGIQDANYFVKLFKASYGVTPKAYRKQHKI